MVYTFLSHDHGAEELTFAGLHDRARAIAVHLASEGARGQRVLLVFPPGLDFLAAFFGCLYAAAQPIPLVPPLRPSHARRASSASASASPWIRSPFNSSRLVFVP